MKRSEKSLKSRRDVKLAFYCAQIQECLDIMAKTLLEDFFRDKNKEVEQ